MGTKIQYIKDDAELVEFRKKTTRSFELGRLKGLGEMSAEEIAETVMNVNTRILKRITMEDAKQAATTFMNLMGESVGPRRTFIEEHAAEANVDI